MQEVYVYVLHQSSELSKILQYFYKGVFICCFVENETCFDMGLYHDFPPRLKILNQYDKGGKRGDTGVYDSEQQQIKIGNIIESLEF